MNPVTLRLARDIAARPEQNRVRALELYIVVADEVVGRMSLRLGDSEFFRLYAGQVGYRVDDRYRGHGYAAAALRALLPLAAEHGFEELWITCNPDNVASRRTLENAGAVLVATVALPPDNDMYARGEREKCRYRLDVARR